jgi:hypothetical protein
MIFLVSRPKGKGSTLFGALIVNGAPVFEEDTGELSLFPRLFNERKLMPYSSGVSLDEGVDVEFEFSRNL